MIFIIAFISISYTVLVFTFILGFNKLKTSTYKNSPAKNTFSIIVAFRNEAENLETLLTSFSKLNYPINLFEIILINDHSDDEFELIIKKFQVQFPQLNISLIHSLKNFTSPKKDAISLGIKHSKLNWIVTTDADCEVPVNWLQSFNQIIEKKQPYFISAPVKFKPKSSFLFHFQNLNFISLIGSTIGAFGIKKPFMCNGANLCYSKNIFNKLNGFLGNENIASGDDIFLLEKMIEKHPEKIVFLKNEEAIIVTNSETSWKKFINQQIRWASKAGDYKNNFAKLVGALVFLENLLLVLVTIFAFIYPFYWLVLCIVFIQKMLLDFILINKTSQFLKINNSRSYFPITSILYPFFTVFIAFLSFFTNYNWKGRTYKK